MAGPTLEELAQQYLVTEDGDTPSQPCGTTGVCNYNDRVQWTSRVLAVRGALVSVMSANKGKVQWSQPVLRDALQFISSTMFLKRYPSMFKVTHQPKELAEMAQRGVGVLRKMLDEAEAEGGVIPTLAAGKQPKDRGLPGNDWYWLAGAGAAVLILWLLFRR